jgi:exopolysaccharide biosynthesis protein
MRCTKAAGVPLKVITVDLNDPNVKITGALTKFGAGHSEPFAQMVHRASPTVAITGTFFCPYSRNPIGDIVIDGQLAHFGGLGTALCITDTNDVEFVRPAKYTHQDWSRYDFVMCSGPRLVTDGIAYVEPWTEGFHDKHMLNRNGRLAVGVTPGNHLVFVATREPVYLSRLAKAMTALGVRDAINLDAGSSMGLHYKGETLIRPSRWLTNLILVYENRDQYEVRKEKLLPVRMRAASK